jgi:hypothetical protein
MEKVQIPARNAADLAVICPDFTAFERQNPSLSILETYR